MNFEFFAFLVFMSFTSFAVAFLAYGLVIRCCGKEGWVSKISQIILIPAMVILYDFLTMTAPSGYRYLVGGLPMLLIAGIALYYRFVKGENFANPEPTPMEMAQLNAEPKKFSKKSARIHAARKKRGKE